ncbi:Anhydro-N-acetylmuramic acid kinase [Planctomycetes bacterium Pan216]|uniref:Anhydro-N-acetylmuramic acid kinase n=1 Tax=Kolteria novifilia TaxID=2527975 RepID=A0A518BBL1_9BACT|nr:Anhydro-N-acetylmuramic acid kinase [Planctomycetes bacterium Pan216]
MTIEIPVWSTALPTRVFAGASIGRTSKRLKLALLRCRGEGRQLRVLAVDALTLPPIDNNGRLIADAVERALRMLAERSDVPLEAVDCFALEGVAPASALGLVEALLAERTGLTIVSNFALRDIAAGGRGGPLSPVPDWFLFRSPRLHRLLVHLGSGLRTTFIEAGSSPSEVVVFDAGPCCRFLDELTRQLSRGRHAYDPNGRFAVQGKHRDGLIRQWSSHPFLLRPVPRFLDGNEFSGGFLDSSLTLARENHYSARDVLCSASQFVIQNLEEAVQRVLPAGVEIDEVWVNGGGIRNGFLWRLLQDAFGRKPVRRSDDLGFPSEARRATHAALLGFCMMENIPGSVVSASGATAPRVLGQITPGDRMHWDRWVCHVADRFDEEVSRQAA